MKKMICIVCPKGCHLTVRDESDGYSIEGNDCEKGYDYAMKEMENPTRVITSTVKIEGAHICRLPVKTASDIPKGMVKDAVVLLKDVVVQAPVKVGDVIYDDILDTGVPFVATRSLDREN